MTTAKCQFSALYWLSCQTTKYGTPINQASPWHTNEFTCISQFSFFFLFLNVSNFQTLISDTELNPYLNFKKHNFATCRTQRKRGYCEVYTPYSISDSCWVSVQARSQLCDILAKQIQQWGWAANHLTSGEAKKLILVFWSYQSQNASKPFSHWKKAVS